MSSPQNTSYTLLQRACDPSNEEAWNELVAHYGRFIRYILKQLNVPTRDIDDLLQQVLIGLTSTLKSYDRTRSTFRNWLGTVIRNKAISYFRKLNCRPSNLCELTESRTGTELHCPAEIDKWVEQEWATYIASQAMARVRLAFKGQAIQAFEMGMEGTSASEIAESTGLTVSSVYTLRKRVKQRLLLEVRSLTEELEP